MEVNRQALMYLTGWANLAKTKTEHHAKMIKWATLALKTDAKIDWTIERITINSDEYEDIQEKLKKKNKEVQSHIKHINEQKQIISALLELRRIDND